MAFGDTFENLMLFGPMVFLIVLICRIILSCIFYLSASRVFAFKIYERCTPISIIKRIYNKWNLE